MQSPVFTPTQCLTCGTHRDQRGFVDLLVDQPVNGRAYMCATCLFQAGRVLRMLDPEQADRVTRRLGEANDRIGDLEAELAHERANKTVPLADALKMLERKQVARTARTSGD